VIAIRPATKADALKIHADLRTEDKVESLIFTGQPTKKTLQSNIDVSTESFVVTLDDEPVLVFGVAPTEQPRVGSVWLRATNKMPAVALFARKQARKYLQQWLAMYPQGLVAAAMLEGNETHLRWLSVVGFRPIREFPVNNTSFILMGYV
jgi:hypothetical protein